MEKVSAGVVEKDGKILIARRKQGKCLAASWEFPGGKLEDSETIEQCLKRELKEELNIDVEVNDYIASSFFFCGENQIELVAFRAKYLNGEITLVDHTESRWISPHELADYEFTLPDLPIVRKVMELYS